MRIIVAIVFVCWLVLAVMSAWIFRGPIEADLKTRAREALDAGGLQVVGVEFDHLDATLTGNVASLEAKLAAATTVERLSGARVVNNHISFGENLAPTLVFEAGEPVTVRGAVARIPEFGDGFDTTGVRLAGRAGAPWGDGAAALAREFFAAVDGGRLELEGRWVKMRGEVPNPPTRWRLVDLADAMAPDLDVIDQLTVADPVPFEIAASNEAGGLKLRGTVRTGDERDLFSSVSEPADLSEVSLDARCVTPPWLRRIPAALWATFEFAIDASFRLDSELLSVGASFPSQFWLDAAERALREGAPSGLEVETDFRVALKAIAEEPAAGGGTEPNPLPIRVSVADDQLSLVGKVRRKDERDALIRELGAARPGLEVVSELRYDWREPRLNSVREALPGYLALAISASRYATIDLDADPWSVRAVCRDPDSLRRLELVTAGLRRFAGLRLATDLRLAPGLGEPGQALVLEDYPVYFKSASAQISHLQEAKLESLTAFLKAIPSDRSITLVGTGAEGGGLALQRARSVRRALVSGGVPSERLAILADGADGGELDWRSDRVEVEIGHVVQVR